MRSFKMSKFTSAILIPVWAAVALTMAGCNSEGHEGARDGKRLSKRRSRRL